jgi:formylglycine-generating enzyme required for sulfatase activity
MSGLYDDSGMAGKIFINYRRGDVRDQAARIRDRLADAFGSSDVFMDVNDLLAGQRFDQQLDIALAETDVLLAIIGPRWMQHFVERQASGERDFVRDEIAAALARRVVVIPVLVEGASLPKQADLPEDLRELVLHQRHAITFEHFGRDMEGLVSAIRANRKSKAPAKGLPWSQISLSFAAICVVTIAWVSAHFFGVAVPWPLSTPNGVTDENLRALAAVAGTGQSFRDRKADGRLCPLCPEMVVAPAGSFTLGSPVDEPERYPDETQIPVAIRHPFAVGKYAITFIEWEECVTDGACKADPKDGGWGRGDRPVINISFEDAKRYVAWLSAKTGKAYRLLSETEREYVTRAGTTTPFWWGSSITPSQANYDGSRAYPGGGSAGEYRHKTVPVDSFKPNPWGIYGVHGNVFEWTEDCWNDSNNGNQGDGSARMHGDCGHRVVRGGSWNNGPESLRAAARDRHAADSGSDNLGFRVAVTLVP